VKAGFASAIALAALLPAGAGHAAPPPPPVTLAVAPGTQPHMPVRIKDVDLNIRLALSFDQALILNSAPAERAGLKAFPLIGKRTFKNSLIPGGEATFRFNLFNITPRGLQKGKVPVVWVSKTIAPEADGVLGVSALKSDLVTLTFGPQAAGAKLHTIPRKGQDEVAMEARIGGEKIRVSLELNSPDTVMNARAAAALASAGLVRRNGGLGFWVPFPGVALPFERMTASAGATLLGLPLASSAVRITETQAKVLDARAKAGTSTADDDEDAITVTASRKKGRDPWILIGRDMLAGCSKIEFDRPAKVWRLTCAT
jgi:hypothetical protein